MSLQVGSNPPAARNTTGRPRRRRSDEVIRGTSRCRIGLIRHAQGHGSAYAAAACAAPHAMRRECSAGARPSCQRACCVLCIACCLVGGTHGHVRRLPDRTKLGTSQFWLGSSTGARREVFCVEDLEARLVRTRAEQYSPVCATVFVATILGHAF